LCLSENAYVEDLVLDVTVFKDGALKGELRLMRAKGGALIKQDRCP
jgi:hypothetical protein